MRRWCVCDTHQILTTLKPGRPKKEKRSTESIILGIQVRYAAQNKSVNPDAMHKYGRFTGRSERLHQRGVKMQQRVRFIDAVAATGLPYPASSGQAVQSCRHVLIEAQCRCCSGLFPQYPYWLSVLPVSHPLATPLKCRHLHTHQVDCLAADTGTQKERPGVTAAAQVALLPSAVSWGSPAEQPVSWPAALQRCQAAGSAWQAPSPGHSGWGQGGEDAPRCLLA